MRPPRSDDVAGSPIHADFEAPASVLARAFPPELRISKQRLRQLEHIELIRSSRNQGRQRLCFSSRPFVLCGLPTRKLPPGQLLYTRRNGQFVLQVTGHPEFGIPYGQDRIVPIFLATLAVQQRSQTIRFRSAAEMLGIFGMHNGGKEYRRLVAAFQRIFGATIFFGTDSTRGTSKVVQRSRFSFLQEAQIWWNRDPNQQVLDESFGNVIVLSDEFYREVTEHPIPTDLEAVKALSGAPAVLDLYMWLAYRCFKARGSESIPIFGPFGLASQIGSVEYTRERRFVAMLRGWLKTIHAIWPECPVKISSDRKYLLISNALSIRR